MSIAPAPFNTRPTSPDGISASRTRLALAIATVGIAATLLAYAVSPGVRHAVGHAEHSVKHAVSNVFDHDKAARKPAKPAATPPGTGQAGPATQPPGPAPTQRQAKAGGG
jgi:type IV secretory pathway VirB10-like protein